MEKKRREGKRRQEEKGRKKLEGMNGGMKGREEKGKC